MEVIKQNFRLKKEEFLALEGTHTANGLLIEKCYYEKPFRFARMICPNNHVLLRKGAGAFQERRCPKCHPSGLKHGHASQIRKKCSYVYFIWASTRSRCTNPKDPSFKSYGAKGITMCHEWSGKDGFMRFLEDMGEPSETDGRYKLERIDGNKVYSKTSCRWIKSNNKQCMKEKTRK